MQRFVHLPYLKVLFAVLILKCIGLYWMFTINGIGLSPDEAQYWTWSQKLDLGYYSKPPGIAWIIGTGTYLFGDTELGVRIGSMLFGFLIPLQLYFLGIKSGISTRASFWSALLFAFSPLGMMASILAITDVGLIFFWICGLCFLCSFFENKKPIQYYGVGISILAAALFKWSAFLLWFGVVGALPFFPLLRSRHLLGGMAVSALALVPTFYWNMLHDWVTVKHVFASLSVPKANQSLFSGNLFEFIGAQAALLSPLLFLLTVASLFSARKNLVKQSFIAFCGYLSFFYLTFLLVFSLFNKAQGNWGDFIYPTLFIVIAWYLDSKIPYKKMIVSSTLTCSIFLCLFVVFIPSFQSKGIITHLQIPYKYNPFRHNIGWDRIDAALTLANFQPGKEFLFSSKYQTSSILSFYTREKKQAYFLNLFSIRKNQFCFWPGMKEEQLGKDGIFVVMENVPHLKDHVAMIPEYIDKLLPFFKTIEYVGTYPLYDAYHKPCKAALLFRGLGYNGKIPETTDLY